MNEISPDDVEALIELFAASRWTELQLVVDGLELTLSSDPGFAGRSVAAAPPEAARSNAPVPAHTAAPAAAPHAPAAAAADGDLGGLVALRAPNLGHFYRSPKPGAPAFVEIGSHVGIDDIVCVIEVMKLFTLLPAGLAGTVRRICVEDAAMVEFDQPLFYIEPDA